MNIDGIEILGITSNSKDVKPGYAFVAIKGENEDGNDYIDEAIEKGAILIITEKDISNYKIPTKRVSNSRRVLSELLNKFYDYPSEKFYLIGITGTNGKTTTAHLIEGIFNKAGYKTGVIGTVGIKIGDEYMESSLTTPTPEILFKTLSMMVQKKVQIVIMETSSHGLKLHRTTGLNFDIAVHTNIEEDHLNFHGSMEDYFNSKKILFDSLGKNKIAVINIDDKYGSKLIQGNKKPLVVTYGLNNKATITASSLDLGDNIKFNLCLQRGLTTIRGEEIEPLEFPVILNIIGKHNVYNALASIAVAVLLGVDVNTIEKSLEEFKGVRRRLQKIYEGDFLVIDDFSHNPASYQAVFETIQSLEYNNIVLVNAIRGNRGPKINRDNAKIIANWVQILGINNIILSLSNDIIGDNDRVSEEEIEAFRDIFDSQGIKYYIFDTLESSINEALKKVKDKDIILLLGAQGMAKGKEIFYKLYN